MPLYGKIVVIKRDGTDGTHFPLTANSCLFGRKRECDIRIQLPQVSKEHCKIEANENKEVILFNLSSVTPTQVNGSNVTDPTYLKHGDILTIIDRSFRFEYPPVSLPQKRRSRSQDKATLQVLHVQQDLCSQDSKNRNPQIPDKELEQGNQTPDGSEKGRSQELVTGWNDASESAYKICQSERKSEISFSSEHSVSVKYEDSTKNIEGNSEICGQDNTLRKDDNMSGGVSQIPNRFVANSTSTDTVRQKDDSHAGNTKNHDTNSVVSSPVNCDVNIFRKSSTRRSSATRSSASVLNYAAKQEEDSEDTIPLKIEHPEENNPEKSKETKSACNDTIRANRQSAEYVHEPCYIVSLDYNDGTNYSQKSVYQTLGAGTVEIKPNLIDSFGSVESALSTPKSNKKCFQVYSSPFTRNARRNSFSKYNVLPVELDSLNEMKYAEASFEIEECSLDTNTGECETNGLTGHKCSKMGRNSKTMVTDIIQTPKEQKNEVDVNYTPKDGNSGTVVCSLDSSNSKSPRRSFKQNNNSVNRSTMMKKSTEELVLITAASDVGRITPAQLSDDNFGRNCPEEHTEKIKQPITDAYEQNVNVKSNMPVFSNLYESNVQTPAEAVSEMNVSSPCISNRKPEIKKSPQKRKNIQLDIVFQPLGKRKRVSFGGQLSPELFDKRLPPNSPLKKGAIPARLSLPFGNSPRAVLKKASGLRQSIIKSFTEREQGNILIETASSPPAARRSPVASPLAARRSPASRRSPAAASPAARRSSAARRSPATSLPAARKSPATSPPAARRSPAASPRAARRSLAPSASHKSPAASPQAARRSLAACRSPAASPPAARRSPAASPPAARRSPATSPLAARRSPAASPPAASRSPATSPLAACRSPASHRSPAASPPAARRSLAASPPATSSQAARRSPATLSPAASPPASRRSPATSPRSCFSCNTPQRKGRFSVSHVACTSPKEQSSVVKQVDVNKEIIELKTGGPSEQESKVSGSVRRSKTFAVRKKSLHRRSGAVDAIQSKRRSGASEANLIVAKSWADIVKQGVPKSQLRTTATKCGPKKSSAKKSTKQSKNNASVLKTPIRKFTGHFTTGHANSPAPIVVGKAHISTVNLAAQVPKVMYNYPLKQHFDLNESFTGMAEMFSTPPSREQEESLFCSEKMKLPTQEAISEINAEAEAEEGPAPSCNVSNQQRHDKEDMVSSFFKEEPQISTLDHNDLQMTLRGADGAFRETVGKDSFVVAVNHTVGTEMQDKSQEQKSETVKLLSGTKRSLETPKQKTEPVEAFSGVKRFLRTPKQKPEVVEALSGVKRLLRTPKQKPEAVEALSGVKRLLRTPKQKPEAVEPLSGVKRLLRTPKQKPEAVEALSGVKRLLRTPKQKPEAVEALSGVKRLLRTPKQKTEPVEVLSGIKKLLRTPMQNLDPVADDIVCAKLMKSPEEMSEELIGSDINRQEKQRIQANIDDGIDKPEKRVNPMEDFEGIQRLFRTPKQKNKPVEDLVGISRLLKTPRQKFLPVDDYLGLQKLMAEPKQNCLSPEMDYSGIKEMLETTDEQKGELLEFVNLIDEENGSYINSKTGNESIQRNDPKHDVKLEDTTGHVISNSFNELKTETDRETMDSKCETNKVKQTQSYHPEGINSQNGGANNFMKEATADLGPIDKEVVEVLASGRRTRRGKVNESSSLKEQTRKIQRYTRNSCRTKSASAVEKSTSCQNTADLSLVQESETSISTLETMTRSSRGESRKHFTETVESVISDNISHDPELLRPSKEASVKMQPYLRRRVTAKLKEEETTVDFKEDVKPEENGCLLDAKTSLSSRNKEDYKNDLKSESVEVNTQEKMQNEDFENSRIENIGNGLKRSRRGKNIPVQTKPGALNAADEEYKTGRKKCIVSRSYKKPLENNADVKENAVKQEKGRKIHFLLEKDDSLPLQEKSALGEKGRSPQKERTLLSESVASSTTQHTSRRSKRKTSVASQPVCFSPSKAKQVLEINEAEYKQDINFSSENIIAKGDISGVSFSFVHEKCGQEGQNGESPNVTQKVQLESVETPTEHSHPSGQKVVKENVPRRGRSKQAICKEMPTQYDSKEADEMKTKENQPKRGRGRKINPQLEIPLPLEQNTLEGNLKTDSFNLAQNECSEQIQNESYPKETQKMTLGSSPITAQRSSQKRQKVGKENPLRRSKRKALNHETTTENVSKQEGVLVDQNMVIINGNLPKRTKGRKIGCQLQTTPNKSLELNTFAREEQEMRDLSSVQEECSLQQPQNAVNPNETQKVPMKNVQVLVEHSPPEGRKVTEDHLPRRGRRKAIAQKTHTEYDDKQTGKEQNVEKKENLSKRGKGRKTAPAPQTLLAPLENNLALQPSTQSRSAVEQSREASETKTTANGHLSHRGRRRKTDIIMTGSVSASKKPRLVDKSNKERMPKDIQDVSKENISKRSGKKQLVLHKTLAECSGQFGNDSEKAMPVKDESIPLQKGSGRENKSKKNKEQIDLASSSLNVSITLPPLCSEKGGTACENQSTVIGDGAVGKARLAKRGSRNKTVVPTTAVRTKYKQTEEEVDHKNNLEKTAVTNQKQGRSNRRKPVTLESTICASLKEKYGLITGNDTISEDLLVIVDNTAAKKNPPRRGKKRQVNSDSETSATTSDTTRDVVLENKLKSKTENSENTTLQKGKRKKTKEEPTRAAAGTAEEAEGRTRGSKRTKK